MAGSSVIGALRVNLGLDSAQFSNGIRGAQSSLQGFAAKFGKIAASITAAAIPAFSALTVSAINSAAEIKRLSQVANATPTEFQRWAAGAKTVGIEQEKMADILKDVNDRVGDFVATGGGPMADFFERVAPKVGVTAEMFRNLSGPQALQLYVDSLQKANLNQQDFTFFMEAMASDSTLLIPLLRDGGKAMAEIGDRAESVGAVMSGSMLAGFVAAKASITDMQTAFTGMRNSLAVIALPVINAVAAAVTSLATLLHEHAETIRTVFMTLAGSAAVVAAMFATRYAVAIGVTAVKAMVAAVTQSIALEMALGAQSRAAALAGVATKAFSGALVMLRGALISTGIGALIVGAGYLIGKFVDIVRATGGIANAFKLMGDVVAGVWDGITGSAAAIPVALSGVWESVKGDFYLLIMDLLTAWGTFMERLGAAAKMAGFDSLSDKFTSAMGGAFKSAEEWEKSGIDAIASSRQKYGKAAALASEGFAQAGAALAKLNVSIGETSESLGGGLGAGLDQAGEKAGGAAGKLSKLQEIMKALKEEAELLKATFGMTDLDVDIWAKQREAGVSAGSDAGQVIDAQMRMIDGYKRLKDATTEWRDSIKGAFASFVTGASSFKDMLSQIIGKLAEMLANAAFDGLFNAFGGNGLMGGVMKMLGFDGGGYTGDAPRTGGIDGKGGFLAVMHPQETVIDHTKGQSLGGGTSVMQVLPSPYFDVVVDGRIHQASPSIVGKSVQASARTSQRSKSIFGVR